MRTIGVDGAPIHVLLVEDSQGDIRLTQEILGRSRTSIQLHVATDGLEAMTFLRRESGYARAPRPSLILLDLNIPKMNGHEVLAQIKNDAELKMIPIVVLTSSDAESDIARSYQLRANCYLSKPVELDEFELMVRGVVDFWLTSAQLPPLAQAG